jgi:WD40 repeat protein
MTLWERGAMKTSMTFLLVPLAIAISVPAARPDTEPSGAILLPHDGAVTSCSITADGKRLVTGCSDKIVRIWDLTAGKEIARLEGHSGEIRDVVFSPDGKRVASIASKDGNVRMWNAVTGELVWQQLVRIGRAAGPGPPLNDLAISADGTKVAYAASDKLLRKADAATGKELSVSATHNDAVLAVAISPNSQLIATGGKDRVLSIWNLATFAPHYIRQEGPDEVSVLTFSPDSKLLAMAGSDRVIRLFDVSALKPFFDVGGLKEVCQLKGHQDCVRSLVFLPDSKTLLSGSQDQTIRVWDVAWGKQVRMVRRHRAGVTALAVSRDGRVIASASEDGSAIVSSLASLRDGKPAPIDLTAQQLEQLWADLARDDSRGSQAVWNLVAGGKHAVPFLQDRLNPVQGPVAPDRMTQLLKELDSDEFAVRENASQELEKLGKTVEEALHRHLQQTPSLEVRRRIERLLEKLGPRAPPSPEQMRTARAVDVLEQVGTPEAKLLLEKLARGEPAAELTHMAKAALERLAQRAETP